MRPITFFRQSLLWQYVLSLLLVALTMLLSYFFVAFMGYKVVALLLLVAWFVYEGFREIYRNRRD